MIKVSIVLHRNLKKGKVLEVKDHILSGADELFCRYGFRSVTMDDLAKHLGMSKKTIYQHYKDKDEIINILIKDRIINQKFQMNKIREASSNAVEELFMGLKDFDFLLSTMNPMLFYDLQKYHTEAWKNFLAFKEKLVAQKVYDNLERGIKEGLYRADMNLDIISRLRLDQMDIIFAENRRYDTNTYSLNTIMTEITRHFLYGICNNEGLKLVQKYEQQAG